MGAIFISYRRRDSQGEAGYLYTDLKNNIGQDSVFMDVKGIALGKDYREVLQERLAKCDIMLVLIGPEWLDFMKARRLDHGEDWVRMEIGEGFRRKMRVIPVLVKDATMPRPDELPEELRSLAFLQHLNLRHEQWESGVESLIRALGLRPSSTATPVASQPSSYASAPVVTEPGRPWTSGAAVFEPAPEKRSAPAFAGTSADASQPSRILAAPSQPQPQVDVPRSSASANQTEAPPAPSSEADNSARRLGIIMIPIFLGVVVYSLYHDSYFQAIFVAFGLVGALIQVVRNKWL